jgi:transcriptional regulator with XRE-family HTH domain
MADASDGVGKFHLRLAPHVVQEEIHDVAYSCVMSDAPQVISFPDLIRDARLSHNMSQEDLERASGVHRNTLSRWESGNVGRPDAHNVRAVCRALGIDPRMAAVSLGFLLIEEVELSLNPNAIPAEVEEALTILGDPRLPRDDRDKWIAYLKFLYQRALDQAS